MKEEYPSGTLVRVTPGGDEIHAGDAAWQAGHRPMVKLIKYEKDALPDAVRVRLVRKSSMAASRLWWSVPGMDPGAETAAAWRCC